MECKAQRRKSEENIYDQLMKKKRRKRKSEYEFQYRIKKTN